MKQNPIPSFVNRLAHALLYSSVTGLGAFTVAALLARLHWLLEITSHFRLQYGLGLAMLALLALMRRKRRTASAAAILLLLNLWPLAPYLLSPNHVEAAAGREYRAISINLFFANQQPERVVSYLQQNPADFLILQEVTPTWARRLAVFEADYPYHTLSYANRYAGVALMSRQPVAITPHWLGAGARPALAATLSDSPGHQLLAIHAPSPMHPERIAQRNRFLADLSHTLGKSEGAVLLMGDLNISPWSPYFRDFLDDSGLRDARIGHGIQPTWPVPMPWLAIPIDHALFSPGIRIHTFATGPDVGSDHRPVDVTFSFPESPT